MKNIYLLQTDKPSRLCYRNYWFVNESRITKSSNADFYHLYIISDEEIKEWFNQFKKEL